MDIAYFGSGRVGSLCRQVIDKLKISVVDPAEAEVWVSVHWRHIFTKQELAIPKIGCLNLHNSYLPWNRGAHACTWAIVDRTPAGATMHWMDEGIDTGDILYQERLEPKETETAHQLYQRTLEAELRVFKVGMELLMAGNYRRFPQPKGGSIHRNADFDRLVRALTTSDCKVIREA